jgi:hypothetical protein
MDIKKETEKQIRLLMRCRDAAELSMITDKINMLIRIYGCGMLSSELKSDDF